MRDLIDYLTDFFSKDVLNLPPDPERRLPQPRRRLKADQAARLFLRHELSFMWPLERSVAPRRMMVISTLQWSRP